MTMKCVYYLAPTLDSTHSISDDLHEIGVNDWRIHVVSKNEAGLKIERIHSSNYLETSDALAGALTGAIVGLIVGFLAALILSAALPPDQNLPGIVYALVIFFPAGFGLWIGALLRAKYDGAKITAFHDEIEAGKYLFLIYAPASERDAIRKMMQLKHPESEYAATDDHYLNPLREVSHN